MLNFRRLKQTNRPSASPAMLNVRHIRQTTLYFSLYASFSISAI